MSGLDRDDPNNACQGVKVSLEIFGEILNMFKLRLPTHICIIPHTLILQDTFKKAQRNFYIKYGDLPVWAGAKEAFFKQKHRMVWERRHGPNTMEAKKERLAGINAESSDGE